MAAQLSGGASALENSARALHSLIGTGTQWRGPDADRFRAEWSSVSMRIITTSAESLHRAADQMRRNADEQDQASATGTAASPGAAGTAGSDSVKYAAAELFARQSRDSDGDGFHIEKVLGADGKTRVIAYFEGLHGADRLDEDRTAKLVDGWVDPHLIERLDLAVNENPDAEIMLVGFSGGGMDAQNIAASGRYNVTTMVTYGSPVIQQDVAGIAIAHLHGSWDAVPYAGAVAKGSNELPPVLNLFSVGANIANQNASDANHIFKSDPQLHIGEVHSDAGYRQVAESFDSSDDSRFAEFKRNVSRFDGVVIETTQ
ncbi:hypothetical protein QYF68_26150 [Mycolicibacterium austroafricanum]|uniref:Alpha/beta hydrolase n=1 Tax=Mycolicibacterium austroafricanum TaxID=39687 RepID=A0ABT8HKJ2_MYCAO|nr:hypothetical protein [Mycolicibacterium austroafricanum]MDN4521278.1 hypothetical protein [Mycolicibacterium austroafricanum]